jgi:hypothetical protein
MNCSTSTPVPLAANDRRLSKLRYHVYVFCNSSAVVSEGRFSKKSAARRWADEVHANATRVDIIFHAESNGWKAAFCDRRIGSKWGHKPR